MHACMCVRPKARGALLFPAHGLSECGRLFLHAGFYGSSLGKTNNKSSNRFAECSHGDTVVALLT